MTGHQVLSFIRKAALGNKSAPRQITDEQAEDAVRLLIEWIGEDPTREGLLSTPRRVINAWKEYFIGYQDDPLEYLKTTFEEIDGYNDVVTLEGIRLESTCEHHLAPIIGEAYIAYIPQKRVVGISKLARVMEAYAKRMQIQERLTAQIAHAINEALEPRGVAVAIRAGHNCITTRGVSKPGAKMLTVTTLGLFETDAQRRADFMAAVNRGEKAGAP